jgi:transcriptional regulator with XRE-family HTH domain
VSFLSDAFGRALRTRRKELGLNQTRLAERMETEAPTISRWENGEFLPSDAALDRALVALNVDADTFLRSIAGPHRTPMSTELIAAVRDAAHEIANSNQYSGLSKDKQKLIALIRSDDFDDATARIMLGYAGIDTDDALGIETDTISDDKENSTPRTRR